MEKDIVPIWQNINDQLMGFVLKKVQDKEDAADILQDVFIKVFSKIGNLKDEDKMTSWIFQITRNSIYDYFRTKKKTALETEIDDNTIQSTLVEKEQDSEFANCVIPMINSLPEKYREALLLSEIEGISQKELAIKLNLSYTGAKSRVQRGREQLKKVLIQCCDIKTNKHGKIISEFDSNCQTDC